MKYTESQIELLLSTAMQSGTISAQQYGEILESANKLRTDNLSLSAGSPALYSQSQRRDESQVSFAHNRDYLGSRCSFSALKQ